MLPPAHHPPWPRCTSCAARAQSRGGACARSGRPRGLGPCPSQTPESPTAGPCCTPPHWSSGSGKQQAAQAQLVGAARAAPCRPCALARRAHPARSDTAYPWADVQPATALHPAQLLTETTSTCAPPLPTSRNATAHTCLVICGSDTMTKFLGPKLSRKMGPYTLYSLKRGMNTGWPMISRMSPVATGMRLAASARQRCPMRARANASARPADGRAEARGLAAAGLEEAAWRTACRSAHARSPRRPPRPCSGQALQQHTWPNGVGRQRLAQRPRKPLLGGAHVAELPRRDAVVQVLAQLALAAGLVAVAAGRRPYHRRGAMTQGHALRRAGQQPAGCAARPAQLRCGMQAALQHGWLARPVGMQDRDAGWGWEGES